MAEGKSSGKALGSLVCGIISVVLAWWGYTGIVSVVLGVVGLILGINANKEQKDGKATAGIILSIIGIAAGAIFFIACVVCVGVIGASAAAAPDLFSDLNF